MNHTAIVVENLSKRYLIGELQQGYKRFSESLVETITTPIRRLKNIGRPSYQKEIFWALKDVSFEIKSGDVVGIIGRNGAGKSTLLKILARITEPNEGEARVYGRIGSLLEVGTGFHPELTGRENVFLNGTILGMKKSEIDLKFNKIVNFSEVEKFIDTPVKRYSSGMQVRLAFAVAAHLEPEILLVDEVLAVGDVAFQRKCMGKMDEVTQKGRTILFVSHNMAAITTLCKKTIWIDSGKIVMMGNTEEVVAHYQENALGVTEVNPGSKIDDLGIQFEKVILQDEKGRVLNSVKAGQRVAVTIEYSCNQDFHINELLVNTTIFDEQSRRLFACPAYLSQHDLSKLRASGRLICTLPSLPLLPGVYQIKIAGLVNGNLIDRIYLHIPVAEAEDHSDWIGGDERVRSLHGKFMVPYNWKVESTF